jgi:threonylcarbamoyladenosine tRNA methylthiotransferase MtaB
MRIAFATLGCKINQYETDLLRQDLAAQGNVIVPFEDKADVYIINTCSVTAKSDTQCRQTIRAAVRRGNGARVVVTGCYAETRPDEIRNIPGVDLVIGNDSKSEIPGYLMSSASQPAGRAISAIPGIPAKSVSGRTRGFLKIQTGCNNHCSYCIVPLARGGSRSAARVDVVKEFERLVQSGCPEIVLTGIHIGAYGNDLPERTSITELLAILLSKRGRSRLRLSSIEPREISDEMIRLLGGGLCRHLHIPLQSGDDKILTSMKRNYTAGFYRDLLVRIAKAVPGVALGADIMVGYPGEGESEFQNTLRFVESVPLTHLHVFSYSPRPGTVAATMKDQVRDPVKKERSEALRNIGKEKNLVFRKKHINFALNVVVEDKVDPQTGLFSGLTDNYMRVLIRGAQYEHIGKEIQVRVIDVEKDVNFTSIL